MTIQDLKNALATAGVDGAGKVMIKLADGSLVEASLVIYDKGAMNLVPASAPTEPFAILG